MDDGTYCLFQTTGYLADFVSGFGIAPLLSQVTTKEELTLVKNLPNFSSSGRQKLSRRRFYG
jgi:hypothetical protein